MGRRLKYVVEASIYPHYNLC